MISISVIESVGTRIRVENGNSNERFGFTFELDVRGRGCVFVLLVIVCLSVCIAIHYQSSFAWFLWNAAGNIKIQRPYLIYINNVNNNLLFISTIFHSKMYVKVNILFIYSSMWLPVSTFTLLFINSIIIIIRFLWKSTINLLEVQTNCLEYKKIYKIIKWMNNNDE